MGSDVECRDEMNPVDAPGRDHLWARPGTRLRARPWEAKPESAPMLTIVPRRASPTPRTGPAGTNVRGEATRERLILAAERLFAKKGIAAVTFSEITRAAGQRSNVAIPYHFGDRDGLLLAITIYRARRTQERRGQMLADLLDQPGRVTVRDVVATIIGPLEIHFEPGNHNLGFQSRLLTERGAFAMESGEDPMGMARELLCRRLPNLPATLVKLRFQLALTSAIHALAHYQDLLSEGQLPAPLDTVIEDLIQFLSAAIQAPVSPVAPWPPPDIQSGSVPMGSNP